MQCPPHGPEYFCVSSHVGPVMPLTRGPFSGLRGKSVAPRPRPDSGLPGWSSLGVAALVSLAKKYLGIHFGGRHLTTVGSEGAVSWFLFLGQLESWVLRGRAASCISPGLSSRLNQHDRLRLSKKRKADLCHCLSAILQLLPSMTEGAAPWQSALLLPSSHHGAKPPKHHSSAPRLLLDLPQWLLQLYMPPKTES